MMAAGLRSGAVLVLAVLGCPIVGSLVVLGLRGVSRALRWYQRLGYLPSCLPQGFPQCLPESLLVVTEYLVWPLELVQACTIARAAAARYRLYKY